MHNMQMSTHEAVLWDAAQLMLRRQSAMGRTNERRFVALYGATITVASILWRKLMPQPQGGEPRHLLWALMILKVYSSEHVHAIIAGVDEKTFRKWSWIYVNEVESLNVV
jgi:hypothetical protein